MPKYTTDICAHCGADRGLHQFETDLCPRFGRESFPAPQQWDETKFEDAGEKRLRDAAPELLAALKQVKGLISENRLHSSMMSPEMIDIFVTVVTAIKKAESL